MRPRYYLFRVWMLMLAFLLLYSCIKTDPLNNPPPNNPPVNPNNPGNNQPPAVTPVGTPVGDQVTETIGSSGGSIVSDDGKIQLNIPAGALASNTEIGIQSVTNEAPGGIGLSYHLTPDGTKFSQPVTLTFHYTDDEINGSRPYWLYIAYQDSMNMWRADYKKRNVDTIAKTVSIAISHFSIWSMGARLSIIAFPTMLHANQTSGLRAALQDPPEESSGSGAGSEDDLPPLPHSSSLPSNIVSNWKVNGKLNGDAQNGTISGEGSEVTYTAPASIPEERTVQVSTEVKYTLAEFNNGRLVSSADKIILFEELTLEPENYDFHLRVEHRRTYLAIPNSDYLDFAEMDVTVRGDAVTVTNISNVAPSINPGSYTLGLCTYTYLTGAIGTINILSGGGYVGVGGSGENELGLQLSYADTQEAGGDLHCPDGSGGSQHQDPINQPPGYFSATFILKNGAQTFVYAPTDQESIKFILSLR